MKVHARNSSAWRGACAAFRLSVHSVFVQRVKVPGAMLPTLALAVLLGLAHPAVLEAQQKPQAEPQKQQGAEPQTQKGAGQNKPAGGEKGPGQGSPSPVTVARVEVAEGGPLTEFPGLIEPAVKVLLSSDVAGRLVELRRREGDQVRPGEVVAVLENPNMALELDVLKARLGEGRAHLTLSRQQQKRVESLYKQKLASQQAYEDGRAALGVAEARVASDKAQVARLEAQLKAMIITSPIGGQVVSAQLGLGQWINPNQAIATIYNFDRYEVRVGIPGRYLKQVRPEGTVTVSVPELNEVFEGRVMGLVRHVESSTGNFNLRVELDNPGRLPLSGLLARVKLQVGTSGAQLSVPRDAVVTKSGQPAYIMVVEEGQAKMVRITTHGSKEGNVIVTGKGLQEGQQVVVRGNEGLRPGTPVRVSAYLREGGGKPAPAKSP